MLRLRHARDSDIGVPARKLTDHMLQGEPVVLVQGRVTLLHLLTLSTPQEPGSTALPRLSCDDQFLYGSFAVATVRRPTLSGLLSDEGGVLCGSPGRASAQALRCGARATMVVLRGS